MAPSVLLEFADGVYRFSLKAGSLEALQEETNAGPMELYRRLLAGTWRKVDVDETIRLALVGGGEGWRGARLVDGQVSPMTDGVEPDSVKVDAVKAARLVREFVEVYAAPAFDPDNPGPRSGPLPWAESALLAAQILGVGLMGKKDEPLGKKPPGEGDLNPSPTAESDGLQSSPPTPTAE